MEDEILTPPEETATVEVVDIQFRPGQKVYYFASSGFTCKTGDHVIIDTARGPEFGLCAGGNHKIAEKDVVSPLRSVLRHATPEDERIIARNRAEEKRAYEICQQKIAEHKLDMQLVSAEYAFDGSKILFFFTADERVDFRELVKNLAFIFHTRIELRQIGVRDKAKMVGGLGICGRPFCCASFLDDFQPVSIKMAKTQNLSLNPTKISGTCGRLMCCLKYEQDAYEDLLRSSPKADSFVDTPEGRGTIVEVNLLRQQVKVRMEDAPETISVFPNAEIAVLRSGKAKKNDPPIPASLAPISGSGKRAHRQVQEEEQVMLEPIRFRYSTENVVDEPEEQTPAEAATVTDEKEGREDRAARSRNRRRKPRPQGEKMQPAERAPAERPEKSAERPEKPRPERLQGQRPRPKEAPDRPKEQSAEGGQRPMADGEKRKNRHWNGYRRNRRPKSGGEGGNGTPNA